MHRLKNSRQILNLGRRSAARWPEQHNPGGPHLSGEAPYLKMVASQNKRFGTYRAPAARDHGVPGVVAASISHIGGRGPSGFGDTKGEFSKRMYDADNCGGPIQKLDWRAVSITTEMVAKAAKHIGRFIPVQANQKMLARLDQIAAGAMIATDYDKRYCTHEVREYERYQALGVLDGIDPGYEVWNDTHSATLEDYQIYERAQPLYHPSITEEDFES